MPIIPSLLRRGLRRPVLFTTLSLLVPYTAYAASVSYLTADEIARRKRLLEEDPALDRPEAKYAPFKIMGRYENPFIEYRVQTIYEFFFNRVVELFERNRGGVPEPDALKKLMPVHKPDWIAAYANDSNHQELMAPIESIRKVNEESAEACGPCATSSEGKLRATWLGQSCTYLEHNSLRMVCDPHFSKALMPIIGPMRITPLPVDIKDVPRPHVVCISHNHPDHIDLKSVETWGAGPTLWVVPEGMRSVLEHRGARNVVELAWWEACEFELDNSTYRVSCVPAMHWSGRSLLSVNRSLWCSYFLRQKVSDGFAPLVFHAGDTGYVNDLYEKLRNKYGGNCLLALLPCGQYCPQWHQKPRHINPDEVLKIMEKLKAQNTLGVHWGTWVLSGEYFREPKELLETLAKEKGLLDYCYCPELGKTIAYNSSVDSKQ